MSPASTIIDQPIAHITSVTQGFPIRKNQENEITVTSIKASHAPRVSKNHASSRLGLPRWSEMPAPAPANSTNTGAQKCVTHRVRKVGALDVAKLGSQPLVPKKSRA